LSGVVGRTVDGFVAGGVLVDGLLVGGLVRPPVGTSLTVGVGRTVVGCAGPGVVVAT
jgi:hypothetical protein